MKPCRLIVVHGKQFLLFFYSISLEKYNSIRRASRSLRDLSRTRDRPLLSDDSGTMTLDRSHRSRRGMHGRGVCQSAPGTLQR